MSQKTKSKTKSKSKKSKRSDAPLSTKEKYKLYERAVQTPDLQASFMGQIHEAITGRKARVFREDFSGTCMVSSHWVKEHPENIAYCLDLDPEPLEYGKKKHISKLKPAQQKRIHQRIQNVLEPTSEKADVVGAFNFSFNIFKEFETLVEYFKAVRASLKPGGLFVLEMCGGPEMMEVMEEKTKIKKKNGKPWFTYIWNQQKFNPIDHTGYYSIDFQMADGTLHRNVFTYDWKIWTLPDLNRALREAGFADVQFFWEYDEDLQLAEGDKGVDGYHAVKEAPADKVYLPYVVGIKSELDTLDDVKQRTENRYSSRNRSKTSEDRTTR